MRAVKGFSLLELILSMTLASLLLTLFVQVLVPIARGTVSTSDKAEVEALASMTLDKLARDLRGTAAAGVSTAEDPVGDVRRVLAIHPLLDLGTDGRQIWDSRLVVWWWNASTGKLLRRVCGAAPTDRPLRLSGVDLYALAVASPETRTIAIHVADFKLEGLAGSVVPSSLNLKLRLQRNTTNARGMATVVQESRVDFPNSAGASVQMKP